MKILKRSGELYHTILDKIHYRRPCLLQTCRQQRMAWFSQSIRWRWATSSRQKWKCLRQSPPLSTSVDTILTSTHSWNRNHHQNSKPTKRKINPLSNQFQTTNRLIISRRNQQQRRWWWRYPRIWEQQHNPIKTTRKPTQQIPQNNGSNQNKTQYNNWVQTGE